MGFVVLRKLLWHKVIVMLWDFNRGICHITKVTLAENNPDVMGFQSWDLSYYERYNG